MRLKPSIYLDESSPISSPFCSFFFFGGKEKKIAIKSLWRYSADKNCKHLWIFELFLLVAVVAFFFWKFDARVNRCLMHKGEYYADKAISLVSISQREWRWKFEFYEIFFPSTFSSLACAQFSFNFALNLHKQISNFPRGFSKMYLANTRKFLPLFLLFLLFFYLQILDLFFAMFLALISLKKFFNIAVTSIPFSFRLFDTLIECKHQSCLGFNVCG